MRISDWSSDVCSSDLFARPSRHRPRACRRRVDGRHDLAAYRRALPPTHTVADLGDVDHRQPPSAARAEDGGCRRSEEHTSELQSLMRISYAVFCLKKKNTPQLH